MVQPKPVPTIFVLYGATGDLAKRMVLPAFFTLAQQGLLPTEWMIVGNGRGNVAHEDFRAHVHQSLTHFGLRPENGPWRDFASRLRFAGGGFDSDDPGSLLGVLDEARAAMPPESQLVHYCAVPPDAFAELTLALGKHGLAKNARVVYEKPFGTSPADFRKLDKAVRSVLDESQIFRIDHFLGKEATQNLHVLRFANGLFSAMWHREHIRAVQIDVPERIGVTDRAAFYDRTGAVLDMLVTHLLQVAAEIAMRTPRTLDAKDLQAAREEVIADFRPIDPNEVVLGQFDGYRDLAGVRPRSKTDTFVAARLWIDNDRWRGVPFLLRTGKLLHVSEQRVSLLLRPPAGPFASSRSGGAAARGADPDSLLLAGNVLSFSMSGSGELDLKLLTKRPGIALELDDARLSLPLADLPQSTPLPPYVRLIHDVLLGDRSLFTRPDGLAAAWQVITPVLQAGLTPQAYRPGSWGPAAAAALAEPEGWFVGQ